MKIINASLLPIGSKERATFPVAEILLEGNIDPVNKTIIKNGIPYALESLQWEILDVPTEVTETVQPETATTVTEEKKEVEQPTTTEKAPE